jgi:hypothetical protein
MDWVSSVGRDRDVVFCCGMVLEASVPAEPLSRLPGIASPTTSIRIAAGARTRSGPMGSGRELLVLRIGRGPSGGRALGIFSRSCAHELHLTVSCRHVCLTGPLLPLEVHSSIAGAGPCCSSFGRELFNEAHGSITAPSTLEWSLETQPCARAKVTTLAKKRLETSCCTRRPWFLLHGEASNTCSTGGRSTNQRNIRLVCSRE